MKFLLFFLALCLLMADSADFNAFMLTKIAGACLLLTFIAIGGTDND